MKYKRTLRVESNGDIAMPNQKGEFRDGQRGVVALGDGGEFHGLGVCHRSLPLVTGT